MGNEISEEFVTRQLESELVDMTMLEMVDVLGDLLSAYTLQVKDGYRPAGTSLAVASRIFEILLAKFGRDVWPPEFLKAWAEIQQLAMEEGESSQ